MTPRTILCFGDSNTHGTRAMRHTTDRLRWDKPDRWPSVMAAALGAGWDVIAEGHPGRTTVYEDPVEGAHKSGQRVLRSLLESHRPIDLVIVMLGTNDLKARFDLTAPQIADGVMQLVAEIEACDSGPGGQAPDILVAAPVAVTQTGCFVEMFAGAAPKSRALPALLTDATQTRGIWFTDLNAVAAVDPVDGIHLDRAAHRAIGAHMARAVAQHLT